MFMERRCSATGPSKFDLTSTLRAGATGNWPARNDHARKCPIQPRHCGPVPYRSTAGDLRLRGRRRLGREADRYLMDQVRDRLGFPETVAAIKKMTLEWPKAGRKLVEDKSNGPAVISGLRHERIRANPGRIPITPEGGKVARAQSVSPQVENCNIYLPHPAIAPGDHGLELPQYVEQLLGGQISPRAGYALSPAERAAAWRESTRGLPHTPPLSDDAISRESIYGDHGR